jgi:hypothetical protein
VLGVSWYFASHPFAALADRSVAVVVPGTLAIAGTAAAVLRRAEQGSEDAEPPTAATSAGTTHRRRAPEIDMGDNFFQNAGQKEPTIPVTAGQEVTINVNNKGQALHNVPRRTLRDSSRRRSARLAARSSVRVPRRCQAAAAPNSS